jgi:hypothetical protein
VLGNTIQCHEKAGGSLHSSWADGRVRSAPYLEIQTAEVA